MDIRNGQRQGGMPSNRQTMPMQQGSYAPQGYLGAAGGPQLFEDTSYAGPQQQLYGPPQGQGGGWPNYGPGPGFQPQQLLNDPVAAMAMQYGSQLAGHGKDVMNQKLEKYVSVSKLKYYFAVDTTYVCKKLALLLFPFSHTDWAVKYDQNEPVPPRYDVNAPDLYIPSMGFVTYVLISGYLLGLKDKFTPEQLGMQASTALMWLTLEVVVVLLSTYILSISNSLRVFDVIAFTSYKFVRLCAFQAIGKVAVVVALSVHVYVMIASLLASLLLRGYGYTVVLAYTSLTLDFFLLRTLRIAISSYSQDQYGQNSRKGLYLLLGICAVQPIMCYFMTCHLITRDISAE